MGNRVPFYLVVAAIAMSLIGCSQSDNNSSGLSTFIKSDNNQNPAPPGEDSSGPYGCLNQPNLSGISLSQIEPALNSGTCGGCHIVNGLGTNDRLGEEGRHGDFMRTTTRIDPVIFQNYFDPERELNNYNVEKEFLLYLKPFNLQSGYSPMPPLAGNEIDCTDNNILKLRSYFENYKEENQNVSFEQIRPIVERACSGCHDGNGPGFTVFMNGQTTSKATFDSGALVSGVEMINRASNQSMPNAEGIQAGNVRLFGANLWLLKKYIESL